MKTIFTLQIDNMIDLITNSSSELFILKGKTKKTILELLDVVYPEWRNEYEEPKNTSELTEDELETYFGYECSAHCWPASRTDFPVLNGFTFDELYEEEEESRRLAWNKEIQYRLKNNIKNPQSKWERSFITYENKNEIINKLDPKKKLWFLFSRGENPNWEMQEKLMGIAERLHLG